MKSLRASSLQQQPALFTRSEWALSFDRSIELDLERGDTVLGCAGLVWATVDSEHPDILLKTGEAYEVHRHQRMRFSGFDQARMAIQTRAPMATRLPHGRWDRTVDHCTRTLLQTWWPRRRGLSA